MKKLLAILLMMPVIAIANQNDTVTTKTLKVECLTLSGLEEITKEFDELPFVRGLSGRDSGQTMIQHSLVIFVNGKTGTWSIVEKTNENLYCFLAVGHTFEPVPADVINRLEKQRQRSKS